MNHLEWIPYFGLFVTIVLTLMIYYELCKYTRPATTIQIRLEFKAGSDAVAPIELTYQVRRLDTVQFDFDYSNVDGDAVLESIKVFENGEDCTDLYTIDTADQKVVITRK